LYLVEGAMDAESELIARAKKGDESAMTALLQPYQDGVFAFLLSMLRNRADAEDAAQETLVAALNGLKKYRDRGRFKSWLYTIAYRQGLRAGARKATVPMDEGRMDEALRETGTPPASPLAEFLRKEEAATLSECLARLPGPERQVLELRFRHELTFKEISNVMQCPLGTALGRARNGLRRLKTMLGATLRDESG
jgi:RNA polymerase sigma-70 factor (ECF subfamily)